MASKTYDTDVVVVGKVTQSGTPSAGGDLITKTYADANYSGGSGTGITVDEVTQAEYAALGTPDPDTLYLITDGDVGVPTTRTISTTTPLTGGGDLSANRTLAISAATDAAVGVVELATPAEVVTGTDPNRVVTVAGASAAFAPIRRPIKADTTTAYTPVLTDENKMVTLSNAGAITVTLPQDSAVALPIGAEIDFLWLGVGQPTFAAGTGATVQPSTTLKIRVRYSAATAKKVAANTWVILGDLSA